MPFIKGRYHINPIMGEALEAAREAEDAVRRASLARGGTATDESQADDDGDDQADGFASSHAGERPPVHRVEIESAEVVPSHSGRAHRGYVARVHRAPSASVRNGNAPTAQPSPPETHVFSDHRDLVDFLRDELAKDCR
jgi:hypothetical protein